MTEPRVGRAAYVLGFAGLLPQAGGLALVLLAKARVVSGGPGVVGDVALVVGTVYPFVILSFLGGMWWGLAMRREEGQGRLVALAVVPSLVALALAALFVLTGRIDYVLGTLGACIIATLAVDWSLVEKGDAPENWLRLRVPLSLGLGALTIALGVLIGDFNLSI